MSGRCILESSNGWMSERMSGRMGRRRGDLLTSSEEDCGRVFNHPNIWKRGDFLSFVCLVGLCIPFNMGNLLKWVSFICNISACMCPYTQGGCLSKISVWKNAWLYTIKYGFPYASAPSVGALQIT